METLVDRDISCCERDCGVGSASTPEKRSNMPRAGLVAAGPPEFVELNGMRPQFLCEDEEVPKVLDFYERAKLPHKVVEVSQPESLSKSHLSKLTLKQRQILITAYGLGYYDVPRRISSEELARHLKLGPSTVVEHLRKAERKLLAVLLAE